jgi:hypothetical protein
MEPESSRERLRIMRILYLPPHLPKKHTLGSAGLVPRKLSALLSGTCHLSYSA